MASHRCTQAWLHLVASSRDLPKALLTDPPSSARPSGLPRVARACPTYCHCLARQPDPHSTSLAQQQQPEPGNGAGRRSAPQFVLWVVGLGFRVCGFLGGESPTSRPVPCASAWLLSSSLMGYLHVQDSGQGLEMELAAGGAPLSAGQKQLVALARALLQHSKASQIGTLFLGLHASLSPQQLESSWRRWPGRCSSTPRQARSVPFSLGYMHP